MNKAGAVFIQPNHCPPVSSNHAKGTPEEAQYPSPIRILPMKRQGSPETGVPPLSITLQVDDLELAHRFRV